MRRTNLLLTGSLGVGKSTLLKRVGSNLTSQDVRGFYSDSIWEQGERIGWRLDTFDGRGGVLALSGSPSPHRMGRYGVDLGLFERAVETQLEPIAEGAVYLVDEIGIIASWLPAFVGAMNALLDSPATVVAIVRQRGEGFARSVLQRSDVDVWEVTLGNRDSLVSLVSAWIAERARQRW